MRTQDNFTMIETTMVVVTIGMLAGLAIPKYRQVTRGRKEEEARPQVKQIGAG